MTSNCELADNGCISREGFDDSDYNPKPPPTSSDWDDQDYDENLNDEESEAPETKP